MGETASEILEMLNDDMVSHGFLAQSVKESRGFDRLKNVLAELLASGRVEVGNARLANPSYVEFIAWGGTADERLRRAMEAIDEAHGHDREFAYWLCLRKNVDRFEGDDIVHEKATDH